MSIIHKTTEASGVDLNKLHLKFSEPLPDAYSDIVGDIKDVKSGGWSLTNFFKNSVALWI
jgi:hypothetical protein